jgi:hypothetical protein
VVWFVEVGGGGEGEGVLQWSGIDEDVVQDRTDLGRLVASMAVPGTRFNPLC